MIPDTPWGVFWGASFWYPYLEENFGRTQLLKLAFESGERNWAYEA
ncbi:hypothetical protein HKBW3S42_00937, partial [Candidatus Hakubella thermalkaliphila]